MANPKNVLTSLFPFLSGDSTSKSATRKAAKAAPSSDELPEFLVTPQDRYPNRFAEEFSSYQAPGHIQKIKEFQQAKGLPATGFLGPQTREALDTKKVRPKTYNAEEYEALVKEIEEVKAKRQAFQNKVKEEGLKIQEGDFFGIRESTYNKLKASVPEGQDLYNCIGGICTFLSDKVDGNMFKKGQMDGIYYSNFDFEKNAAEEGWQQHPTTKFTKPDIGDIIVKNSAGSTKHAFQVVDFNPETKKYKVVDNQGGTDARVQEMSLESLQFIAGIDNERYDGKPAGWFYRRVGFDGKNLADLQRATRKHEGWDVPNVPEEMKNREQFSHTDFKLKNNRGGNGYNKFVHGVNKTLDNANELFPDISPDHLRNLALIMGGISQNESRMGEDQLDLDLEKGPGYDLAKFVRNQTRDIQDPDSPLSVGISQINPQMIDKDLLEKYFPGKSDPDQIAKSLANNPKLQGQVSMEMMARRYRHFRQNPNMYNNDPEKFFYLLAKGWQSPGYALNEKNKDYINNWDVDYSNNAMEAIDKHFKIKEKEQGGQIGCDTCLKKFTNGGEGDGAMDKVANTLNYPQKKMMALLTGKEQVPSEYLREHGIDNPVLGFTADVIADPLNFIPGFGLVKSGKYLKHIPDAYHGAKVAANGFLKAVKGTDMVLDGEDNFAPVYNSNRPNPPKLEEGGDPFWTPGMMFDQRVVQDIQMKDAADQLKKSYNWGSYTTPVVNEMDDLAKDAAEQMKSSYNWGRTTVDPVRSMNDLATQAATEMKQGYNWGGYDPPEVRMEQKEVNPWKVYAPQLVTMGMGVMGDMMVGREQEEAYNQMQRRQGNSDSRNATNPQNVYGNYTLNTGIGANFRPNQTGFKNFEEGGEYEMSEEELKQFLENGGEVEIL